MGPIKINDTVKHIFKEAILDAEVATTHGNTKAAKFSRWFKDFLDLGEIPMETLGDIYSYYIVQETNLVTQTDPRMDGLKSEISYMLNFLRSNYDFEDINGMVVVREKEGI